jgi:anthranilate synthase
MGFVDPPLVFTTRARRWSIEALNRRGRVLLPAIERALAGLPATTAER